MVNNDDPNQPNRYEDIFLMFSALVEKWLVRATIGLLTLLLIFQLLLLSPSIRYYLVKVEQLEGVSFVRSE
ncbi:MULTISPECIES: hypothetical protein [unclassified Paenibacillus]|uniref:hypothetical protein n=1 Tax=unclassified Paenibacillus TaxID=185978 RepID=UPI00362A2EF4